MTFTIEWADVAHAAGWGCAVLGLATIGFLIGMALFSPRWG